jgi:uncharacterized protein YjbJ (UPF0337 family)
MKTNELQGKLKQVRGKVTEQWGNIVDHDLDKIMGKREQLVGLMQEKYGDTRDKAEQDLDYLLKKMKLRRENSNHAFGIVALFIGSLLTIAVLGMLASRRLASA